MGRVFLSRATQTPLLRALRGLSCELPRNRQIAASDLEREIRAACLGAAELAFSETAGLLPVNQGVAELRTDPDRLGDWRHLGDRLRIAGIEAPHLFALTLSPTVTRTLLEAICAGVDCEAGGAAIESSHLGEIHQTLLGLELLRADSLHLCLKPHGYWVSLRELCACPPELRFKWLRRRARLSQRRLLGLDQDLRRATTEAELAALLTSELCGPASESTAQSSEWFWQLGLEQRRAGAHYTPPKLCEIVVGRALAPLLARCSTTADVLALRVCDPAMGCGAFLLEACRQLAAHAAQLTADGSRPRSEPQAFYAAVAGQCLYGLDQDATAVRLARLSVRLLCNTPSLSGLDEHLRTGDALVGQDALASVMRARTAKGNAEPAQQLGFSYPEITSKAPAFHWPHEFPEVFTRERPGFDACIGNPPWVAYVGRAAQPLDDELRAYFSATNPAFRRYKTLHGLFVVRAARLLRSQGRLGLVLPTSVADLGGYEPTRRAHDCLCRPDPELPDFGDGAFQGVFQPCMAILSTRIDEFDVAPFDIAPQTAAAAATSAAPAKSAGAIWNLARSDLNECELSVLAKLDGLPKLPPELFGEWGFQTTSTDLAHFRCVKTPTSDQQRAIHEGRDLAEFALSRPSFFIDSSAIEGRLREPAAWRRVAFLVRQTARYPIAQLGDGEAFRNSLLAGFAHSVFPPALVVGYLNSSLARWFHFKKHRDARQGMPQLKIAHLRSLPALPEPAGDIAGQLCLLSSRLAERNRGSNETDRELLDNLVFRCFGLEAAEQSLVIAWARAWPPPKKRQGIEATPVTLSTSEHSS